MARGRKTTRPAVARPILAGAVAGVLACGLPGGSIASGDTTAPYRGLPAEKGPASAAGPVRAELVADAAAVRPAATFRLGVLFRMQRGWHIYWKDPGEAGLATAVDFRLPPGVKAGPLRWPAPVAFRQEGGMVGYGYEREVLLWAPVRVGADVPAGQVLNIRVEAAWLACREMCLAGEKSLRLRLPVREETRPANCDLFGRWRGRLPVEAGSDGSPLAGVSVSGGIEPGRASGRFVVRARWARPPGGKVACFPAGGASVEVTDLAVRTRAGQTQIDFAAELLTGGQAPAPLEMVLTAGDGDAGRSVRLAIPLRAEPTSAAGRAAGRTRRNAAAPREGGQRKGERHD